MPYDYSYSSPQEPEVIESASASTARTSSGILPYIFFALACVAMYFVISAAFEVFAQLMGFLWDELIGQIDWEELMEEYGDLVTTFLGL